MSNHPWSLDPAGQAAIRRAEDGRTDQVPTLKELFAAVPWMVSDEVIAHGATLDALAAARESLAAANRGITRLTAERDAARAECERLRRPATWQEEEAAVEGAWSLCGLEPDWPSDEPGTIVRHAESMRREIGRLRDRVAGLESGAKLAPQARGWLTKEERDALGWIVHVAWNHAVPSAAVAHCNIKTLDALLARSTPPRVKVPPMPEQFTLVAWNICVAKWLAAIREAGVEVAE